MNILIIGCGQLGARLANILDAQNHEISIIGSEQNLISRLNENFSGLSVPGSPIDLDVMKSAGIEGCDCVICTTDSDNANIMAAQIIKKNFVEIENIFVRILDPEKCQIYSELNLKTISPTSLAFNELYSKIFSVKNKKTLPIGTSLMDLTTMPYEKWMKGKKFCEVEFFKGKKLIGYLEETGKFNILNETNINKFIEKTIKLIYISADQ